LCACGSYYTVGQLCYQQRGTLCARGRLGGEAEGGAAEEDARGYTNGERVSKHDCGRVHGCVVGVESGRGGARSAVDGRVVGGGEAGEAVKLTEEGVEVRAHGAGGLAARRVTGWPRRWACVCVCVRVTCV